MLCILGTLPGHDWTRQASKGHGWARLGRTGHSSALLIRSDGRHEQHPQQASPNSRTPPHPSKSLRWEEGSGIEEEICSWGPNRC